MMDIRVMKYFLAVVSEGTVNGAARKMHVSQPALSKQLKDLEDELGKQLFIRGHNGITLTDEGRFFRQKATEIVELAEETARFIESGAKNISGTISVCSTETISCYHFADAIAEMLKIYPEVDFKTWTGDSADILERVDGGLCDFGLIMGRFDLSRFDSLKLTGQGRWGLLCRRDMPIAQKNVVTPADLLQIPLIVYRAALDRYDVDNYLGYSFEKLNIVASTNLAFNSVIMVKAGVGAAMMLQGIANSRNQSDLCWIPFEPIVLSAQYLVWKKGITLSKAALKYKEFLRQNHV